VLCTPAVFENRRINKLCSTINWNSSKFYLLKYLTIFAYHGLEQEFLAC
jgi:hypothetical protein